MISNQKTTLRFALQGRRQAAFLGALYLLGATPVQADISGLQQVATGFSSPVYATHAPGDTDRLFVVEKGGNIKILNLTTGSVNAQSFLNITDTDDEGEGGLLGLAFHPDYATNGKFYTYVTVDNGGLTLDSLTSPYSSHIREYTVSANPDIANTAAKEIVSWVQPKNNHNGGWIGFSPVDNYLYITSGDGGKQGDPDNNAQTLYEVNAGQTLDGEPLGKILRIDIDGDDFPADANRNYAIPTSNPYHDTPNSTPEIWSSGLRNPWRASFDRLTGDFWIGDVGQNLREEINFQPANSLGDENYGWQRREGTIAHLGGTSLPGDTEPVYDYEHGDEPFEGNSVVGGYVYRGPDPTLQGTYIFTDSVSDNFWSFDPANPTGTVANINGDLGSVGVFVVSFAEDAVGNLYTVDLAGHVWRIVTDTLLTADFDANGAVNDTDFFNWEANFSQTSGAQLADGDADNDNDVDGIDFLHWQQNHGATAQNPPASPATAAIPEPHTLVLAILGYCLLPSRRRN